MSDVITEYADYDAFAREWHARDLESHSVTLSEARARGLLNEQDTRQIWQLLDLLEDDELFLHLPQWLADEKVDGADGDGDAPTTFVGRLSRETDKAILVEDSAATHALMRLAHGIRSLERGLENTGADADRREELEQRLQAKYRQFETREGAVGLADEWVPKSQIRSTIRRRE
ncbi:hypothetical protein [Halopiger aswanensis]|uniref:Uncharacterized protein n=1 Tax=Halopiger aswanensis TaxID=148449 RepID=A0A3R7DC24_9EURY|nr:hypothetical protein [Halopiger aswanensis]RKD93810.1 hypothetical protein ATJ93_3442 [Halopiger aswanensis]